MKNSSKSVLMVVMVAIFGLSACSVEYRTRHPRPVRHKRVIVVGKADVPVLPNATVATAVK